MSLADRLFTIDDRVRNRILILDVERLPGITTQYWWDRSDLKNRYVHYETVQRQPRTTIVCAKWYDSDEVIELSARSSGYRPRPTPTTAQRWSGPSPRSPSRTANA